MKKTLNLLVALGMLAALITAGCSNGGTTNAVSTGKNSVVVNKASIAVGDSKCPTGGITVEVGIDKNGNFILDPDEVDATKTQVVCNGAKGDTGATGAKGDSGDDGVSTNGTNGKNALVAITEAEGCDFGGKTISVGVDADGNSSLGTSEVTSSVDMCNAAWPVDGTPSNPTFAVKDTTGASLAGATVYAIPADDVVAMSAVALDSTATATTGNYSDAALAADEPLEDLINGNYTPTGSGVDTYKKATTDDLGRTVLKGLSDTGKYFIYVQPAGAGHLPGGSICRTAMTGASLDDKETAIKVSTKPSASATFVGSSKCLSCHQTHETVKKTLHKLGIRAMGVDSGLQDASEFTADPYNIDNAMTSKMTTTGTTIYFYDYDGNRGFDKYKTLESAPTGTVWATVRVYKGGDGKYYAEFTNVINPADPSQTHEIMMSYGGGVYKQRFMTAIGDSMYLIPLQFNQRGDEASTDRVRKQWRDYHMDWWISNPTTTPTFRAEPSQTFDKKCASCHFNGFAYDGDKHQATGVLDPNGEVHPVLGTKQELNLGCESCHGPGSEHVAAGGAGRAIVSPSNITPERASMICGQCHSRPQGKGIGGDSPVNASNKMMIAGTSREDFLANYTSRNDAASGDLHGDSKKHSKAHHQQYTDFIRSGKYRNGTHLLTCASCHNPHGPGTDRHQLSGVSDNSKCTSCHTSVTHTEPSSKTGDAHVADATANAKCIDCHNTKTSNSGAGFNQTAGESKLKADGTPYLHGDISSHMFDVPRKSEAALVPIPYTNFCGSCHTTNTL